MSQPERRSIDDVEVDLQNLYREETYTDLKVASIRCLVPIKPDGSDDGSREKLYTGETTIMSQAGPLPVNFRIEAASLEEAANGFPAAMKEAVDRLMEEAAEMRRRESSRLVTPDEVGGLGNLTGGGGLPGGRIKLR